MADCVDLMTAGRWVTGRSNHEIAKKHGVAVATVKDWATSASRVIRLAVEGDKEDIRARMLATLDTVIARAMEHQLATKGGELYDAPDLRSVVAAIETQAKLLGLTREQVHVTGTVAQLQLGGVDEQVRLAESVLEALKSRHEPKGEPS